MPVLKRDYLPEDLLPELRANESTGPLRCRRISPKPRRCFCWSRPGGIRLSREWSAGWTCVRRMPAIGCDYFSQFPKLRGFRHVAQSEPDDRFLVRDDFVRGVSMLGKFDLTYDILIYARQLPAAVELVEKLPEQAFVLDHIGKPTITNAEGKSREFDNWAAGIRALARNPRVYCKLSGLITEADWGGWRADDFKPYLDVVFDAFGADRLMFGSDWPVCLLAGTYAQVKGLIEDYVCGFARERARKDFRKQRRAILRVGNKFGDRGDGRKSWIWICEIKSF